MTHNGEAGGSGLQLMYWQSIPVPLQFKLPHGWHLSNTGYVEPSLPLVLGPKRRALIAKRRAHMSPAERSQPASAQNNPTWPRRFQEKRDNELARLAGSDASRFNRVGRRDWWQGRDVDTTLAEYGFKPRIHGVDPTRVPLFYPQAQCMAPEAPPL
jgi:hypothetical protein